MNFEFKFQNKHMLEKLDALHILASLFYGRVRDYKTHHNFLRTCNNSKIQVPKRHKYQKQLTKQLTTNFLKANNNRLHVHIITKGIYFFSWQVACSFAYVFTTLLNAFYYDCQLSKILFSLCWLSVSRQIL
jgi:hypothetical protein